jgi:DNA-binding transcriptional LysR family regulator
MTNTELRQIRHIVALGAHLSFTNAAKVLGITQSALTRSIQGIEEKAGVRLFDRDRGRVSLTEVGKVYLGRAEALLQDAEDLDRLLHQTAVGEIGEVHFGMTSAIARALLPDILVQELHHRPHLREMIRIHSPDTILELVQSEAMEFCVCGEQLSPPAALRSSIIGTMPLSLLVRAGHPLAGLPPVHDMTGFPVVLSGQQSDSERLPDFVHPLRLAPPSVIVDDLGVLHHLVLNTDAIWLTAAAAMAPALRSGSLVELSLPRGLELRFRIVMYSHQRRTLSPAARRLADMMRAQAARWIAR